MRILFVGWLGAGSTEVAALMGASQGIEVLNSHKAIRDLIKERGQTFQLFETESSSGMYDLDVLLRNKVLEYLEEGGDLILEGRLGLLACDQEFDVQVFLTANFEDRAKRIARGRGVSGERAREIVSISDKDRKNAYQKIHDEPLDPTKFDLLMNTSTFSFETVVSTIERLLKKP